MTLNEYEQQQPTKTDILTLKSRGSVYNAGIGVSSSNAYANVRNNEIGQPRQEQRTATLQKYNTLGRRPLPLTPDEMKQSKETPIPKVPDEMPLSAANLSQFRSLQRGTRMPIGVASFNSLQRRAGQVGPPPTPPQPPQVPQKHASHHQQQKSEAVYSNNEHERQLYAVTEL